MNSAVSYSQNIKNELFACYDSAKHCNIAELAGIFAQLGRCGSKEGEPLISIKSDNERLIRKCFTLAEKSFNIKCGAIPCNRQGFTLEDTQDIICFTQGLKLLPDKHLVNPMLLHHECCKRAFLRGSFLAVGSMSDPESSYHLEFVCGEAHVAGQLLDILEGVRLTARIVERKGRNVVYLKDGAAIVELLGIMGAHKSLMELENLRILKEMRESINRRVNCETANISKTVNASSRQIEDITLIRDHKGFSTLPGALREMALIRLEHPHVPLKELGELLDPPIGKSGVNHRLRKIGEIADRIRDGLPDIDP